MKRRVFLKTLSAAAATSVLGFPDVLNGQSATRASANDRLTIGVIGAGGQGNSIMGNALANSHAQIVAVCDVDVSHRKKARERVEKSYADEKNAGSYRGCAEYNDFRQLLARPDIDAVLIATPDHWHALVAVLAAQAGKHIYCEKPAGTSIAETRAMITAVAKAGVVCQIGSQQRSASEFQRIISLTRGGYLGEIKSVKVGLPAGARLPEQADAPHPQPVPPELDYDLWLGPAEHLPYFAQRTHYYWRHNFAFSGGRLTDWIGHHHDIATLAMGVNKQLPVAIRNARATFISGRALFNTAWTYNFDAHYANGVVINLCDENREGLTIQGTEGTVHVTRGRITHSSDALAQVIVPANLNLLARGPRGHMDDFIHCALHGGEPRCPILDAHCAVGAGHLANAAFRSGRSSLEFDPTNEQIVNADDAAGFMRRPYRGSWTLPA